MNSKGIPFKRECRLFEVWDPQQAQSMLLSDIAISAVLPCRISVNAEAGETVMASIEPRALLGLFKFDSAEAIKVANSVRETLVQIMNEAGGSALGDPSI